MNHVIEYPYQNQKRNETKGNNNTCKLYSVRWDMMNLNTGQTFAGKSTEKPPIRKFADNVRFSVAPLRKPIKGKKNAGT